MKTTLSLVIAALFLTLYVRPAHADLESDKAASGMKFLETGGRGSPGASEAAVDARGGSGADARDPVNAPASAAGLKTAAVPAPAGDALGKAVGTAQAAVYGAVAGLVIGGVAGIVGGPMGMLGGGISGAKLGTIAGAAIGACVGFLLAGKAAERKTGLLERRQQELDDALKGN